MLIVGGPGLPGCNAPGRELPETFENWLACGVACCTLMPGVTPEPTSWVERYEVGRGGSFELCCPMVAPGNGMWSSSGRRPYICDRRGVSKFCEEWGMDDAGAEDGVRAEDAFE